MCTDSVLPSAASGSLKGIYPNFMTLRIESSEDEGSEVFSNEVKQKMFEEKESLPIKDVFEAFVKDIYGKNLDEYEKEVLFVFRY